MNHGSRGDIYRPPPGMTTKAAMIKALTADWETTAALIPRAQELMAPSPGKPLSLGSVLSNLTRLGIAECRRQEKAVAGVRRMLYRRTQASSS